MSLTSCLLLGLFAGSAAEFTRATVPDRIMYREGSYTVGGQRIKFFAFTYRGEFSIRAIQVESSRVMNEILRRDVSAVFQTVPSSSGRPPQRALRLDKGQILVLGWINGSPQHSGWLAADTDGRPLSRHRWLASSGDSGMLDSGKAWLDPQRSTVRLCWRVTRKSANYVILQLDATMGRLEWFMDWQDR